MKNHHLIGGANPITLETPLKFTASGGVAYAGRGKWRLPIGDQPGEWMRDYKTKPVLCGRGYHWCVGRHALHHMHAECYLIETRGVPVAGALRAHHRPDPRFRNAEALRGSSDLGSMDRLRRLRAWNEYGEGADSGTPNEPGYTHDSLDFQRDLRALLSERDAATARAEFLRTELDLQLDNLDATKRELADLERHFGGMLKQRDAAIAERDALRDEWEEIAAGITTEQPEVGALWPMVSEINGNLAAARNLFRNEVVAHNRTKAERDRLREALEIVAGYRQCMDNLMSNVDVARVALTSAKEA